MKFFGEIQSRLKAATARDGSRPRRINFLDWFTQATVVAASIFLALLPLLLTVGMLSGRDVVAGLGRHIGLNADAANDVRSLFRSESKSSTGIATSAVIFAVFGGIGTAATLQRLYEHLYELPARGRRDVFRQLLWLVAIVGFGYLSGWVGPAVARSGGGRALATGLGIIGAFCFWLFTSWILLSGRVQLRALVPSAVATTVLFVGLKIVSDRVFSNLIVQYNQRYGPIGVTFALLSWLIAIAFVVILGAVSGGIWRDRAEVMTSVREWVANLRGHNEREHHHEVDNRHGTRSSPSMPVRPEDPSKKLDPVPEASPGVLPVIKSATELSPSSGEAATRSHWNDPPTTGQSRS